MRASRLAFLAFALAGLATLPTASCSSTTDAVVVIDGDAKGIDTVVVRIESNGKLVEEKTARLSDTPFPLTLGVVAGGDDSAPFTVRASARRGSDVVIEKTARAKLVSGQRSVLVVALCSSCSGVVCASDETCTSGACRKIADEPALGEWSGSAPSYRCDAPIADGGSDGSTDGGVEGGAIEILEGGYHRLDDDRNWTTFDLESIDPNLVGYAGAAFDGANIYLSPFAKDGAVHGRVVRYETGKSFTDKAAWSTFDLSTLDGAAKGYGGAATFKTDFVYFVPNAETNDVVARYKVGAPFGDPTSWSTIHLGSQPSTTGALGLGGAVVNFSHVWMPSRVVDRPWVLHDNGLANDPIDAGWQKVNPQTVDAGLAVPGGYYGGAFDLAHLMYFTPNRAGGAFHGVALMRDINNAGGDVNKGWVAFDIASLNADARGYAGAVFDGKYVTFVPSQNEKGVHGLAARVDTQSAFDAAASWEVFDLTTILPEAYGFIGGVYDGRFIYFVPATIGTPRLWVVRFDTKAASLKDPSAWSRFDLRRLPGAAAVSFHGAAFDGKNVYLVPFGHGPVLKFEARETVDKNAIKSNGSFL